MGRGKLASPTIFRPSYRHFFYGQQCWLRLKRGARTYAKAQGGGGGWGGVSSLSVLFLLVTFSAAMHALCESDYVTIAELRESLPERWVGEYVVQNGAYKQLEKGDTVAVDVPIVVPRWIRCLWYASRGNRLPRGLDESLEVVRDDWNAKGITRNFPMDELAFPVLEDHMTFTPELPPGKKLRPLPWRNFKNDALYERQRTYSVLPRLLWRFKWKRLSGRLLLYDLSWHTASH